MLTVRPDAQSAGLQVAALVNRWRRTGREPSPAKVTKLHVTVNLAAAKEVGYRVPLSMLARADQVRRSP